MWSLYEKGEKLQPLEFSNGKNQEDVVKEIIEAINSGHKIIFLKGVCGTGKSAIALNLAKELGKASIVVPVKSLQKQYEEDYANKKYLFKNNGKKLKIRIITGRANFACPYLKENKIIEEQDSNLDDYDKFIKKQAEYRKKEKNKTKESDDSCDSPFLPCKIQIKEANAGKIKKYLDKNPRIQTSYFMNANKVRRLSIAPVCPYWSPLVPAEIDYSVLENSTCKNYTGLKGKEYTIYQRKQGCGYYDQYQAYIDSDVIIFNSQKYKLETLMNRKPATEIEIIDECDEFLDNFSNEEKINLNRFNLALGRLFSDNESTQNLINELIKLTSGILKEKGVIDSSLDENIVHIKNTKIADILKIFLDSSLMDFVECDEENYCYHCDRVARMFEGFLNETYVSFSREDNSLFVRLVTTNLEKRFKELADKNKVLVMMSGTIHSEKVLKDIFGISDFKIIEAEAQMQGKLDELRTGDEINCKYSNFQQGIFSREQYLKSLAKTIKQAEKPVLVHVNSFKDLPSEQEAEEFKLDIMTREKLKQLQNKDNLGEAAEKFKKKEIEILYSTKCNRGVDFPGDTCNSIILTKYPYPNINSLFWKVLRRTKPQYYNEFYLDKSRREFLQRIYRALRSKNDHVFLLSPDIRVFSRR